VCRLFATVFQSPFGHFLLLGVTSVQFPVCVMDLRPANVYITGLSCVVSDANLSRT